jgi:RHS repeat-associated protein
VQQTIIEGLATGRDVRALLQAVRQTSPPAEHTAVPPRSTIATDLQAQLGAFQRVLARTAQTSLSETTIGAVERAYQQVQAAHLLMAAQFQSTAQELVSAALPAAFEARRQATAKRYDAAVSALLAPLAGPLAQLQATSERATLIASATFQRDLMRALQATLTVLTPHLTEPPSPMLRAQTLPVRLAAFAPATLHLTPTIQPSYLRAVPPPPTPADLAATPDAPFHPEILAQAALLEHDYVRIYEFVRNDIATEWYAGAMKGALGTLRQKRGNTTDQASLLIALLRASSAPARYVHGVLRFPMPQLLVSLGLKDAAQVPRFLAAAGLAHRPVVEGSQVVALELESTWVAAAVPYTNYRGTVVDTSGPLWLPLMPAFKAQEHTPATQILSTMGLPSETLVADYLAQPQTLDLRAYLEQRITTYLQTTGNTATYVQQLSTSHVVPLHLGLLPSTLPVAVTAVTAEDAVLNDNQRQRLRVVARMGVQGNSPILLDYTVPVADVLHEQLTLSYLPATVDDQQLTNLYGGLDYVPAYLIQLRPQLLQQDRLLAAATEALEVGQPYRLEMHLLGPAGHEDVSQTLIAGAYHALDLRAPGELPRLADSSTLPESDALAAALLSQLAAAYSTQWTQEAQELAGLLDVAVVQPWPAVTLVHNAMHITRVFDQPHQLTWEGVTLDAALRMTTPITRGTTSDVEHAWLRLSALHGSSLEHQIFEQRWLVESISADKGLQQARTQGITVHRLTAQNAATILPSLQHPQAVLDDLAAWVGQGLTVEVPAERLTYKDWRGSIWRVEDPASGAGGYFLSGGLAGGSTSVDPTAWALQLLREALAAPNTPPANRDPRSATSITAVAATDGQNGEVGESVAQKLAVLVRDAKRRPVAGVPVIFTVTTGGGCMQACPAPSAQVSTNARGIAEVTLILGKTTAAQPRYVQRRSGDTHLTQAGLHLIDVAVEGIAGPRLVLATSMSALAYPKPATQLRLTDPKPDAEPLVLTPGITNGWITVQAVDIYDNPVSNVAVTFTPPGVASESMADCPYEATKFIGTATCSSGAQDTESCGQTPYTELTTISGVQVALVAARGTREELLTISAAELPSVHVRYKLAPVCDAHEEYFLLQHLSPHPLGTNLHAARIGWPSQVPVSFTLYRGSSKAGYKREEPWREAQVEPRDRSSGACVGPRLMDYLGKGTYVTFLRPALLPRLNDLTVRIKDEKQQVRLTERLIGVIGLRLRITNITSQEVPTGQSADLIYLDETFHSRFPTLIQYTVEPDMYVALRVDVDLFEDGVWIGSVSSPTQQGPGQVRLPRGAAFNPEKTYAAELVVNRGTVFEVRSPRVPLPLRPPLILQAPTHVYVRQDVDTVNARSCSDSTDFVFALSEEARVSLVFADQQRTQDTLTLLDAQVFAAGAHKLPVFLPGSVPDASSSAVYSLPPGHYRFALTAVATGAPTDNVIFPAPPPPDSIPGCPPLDDPTEPSTLPTSSPNQDARLGSALVTYRTDRLPIGHTLVHDIDVATGTLTLGREDLQVPGRGVPLAVRRTYGTPHNLTPGPLGLGWQHNYQALLEKNLCGDVLVHSDTGTVRFAPAEEGAWQPLRGFHGTLRYTASSDTYDFWSTNGNRYHFQRVFRPRSVWPTTRPPEEYRLAVLHDPNGNVTKLGYDPSDTAHDRLLTVEDAAQRTLTFTYEEKDFAIPGVAMPVPVMTGIIGPDGQGLTFDYDSQGHLIRAAREGDARVETYTYTPTFQVAFDPRTLRARLHGHLETVTDANGQTTLYGYEPTVHQAAVALLVPNGTAQPRIIPLPSTAVASVTRPASGTTQLAYNVVQHQTTVINGRGAATTYTLNTAGAVVAVQDPVGGTTTTTWLTTEPLPASRTNARGIPTQYTYDVHGNVLTETVDNTFVTSATYALLGGGTIKNRVATQTDRNGQMTRFFYDAQGNLLQQIDAAGGVTAHTYSSNGDRLSTQDPNGHLTRYTYDRYGNLATTTDALNGVTRTEWDARSRPMTRTDALGRATHMTYDTLNRLSTRTDPLGQVHTWTYDPLGNLLVETDEGGRTTTMLYDGAQRLIQRTNALGNAQTFTYDTQGNKTSETDFRGNVTTFTYDAADRLLQRAQPLGRVTTWTYDAVGNRLTETDALARTTTLTYDALNRRLTTTDALGGVTTTTYNGVGNPLTQTDANGHTTTMIYDARNRLIRRLDPLGAPTTYAYDATGNQVAETDANGQQRTRAYDKLHRLRQRTDALGHVATYEYDAVGNLLREINARLHATTHAYDALNRRIQTTDPARFITTYAYDAVGNRTVERWPNGNVVVSSYDALNRLVQRTDALGLLSSIQYDADGNRLIETDANGQPTHNTYNALNQLVQQDLPADRTRTFAYDRVGNRLAETDANGYTTTFAYDARNRVRTTTDPLGYTVTQTYDAVGNRLTQTDQLSHTTTSTYDARNRLLETRDPLSQHQRRTYDLVGNLLTETDKRGTTTTYTYDAEKRVLTTAKAGVIRRTLEYDAVGNVALETDANGNTTAFVYDPRNLRLQESRPLAAITNYTYDAMGDRLTTRDPEGHTTRLTYDLRRRLLTTTNGMGETTTYAYDGLGNRVSRQRPLGPTWTYAYDAASRLTTVTDPLESVTQYTYDGNGNRLTQTDATGATTTFTYDALNRLLTRRHADRATATLAYDEAGNRTVETDPDGQTLRHTYDALHRRIQTDYPLPRTPTDDDLQRMTYAYDGNANLLQVVETFSGTMGTRLTSRTYDALDRLLGTTDPDGQTLRYTYDAHGNRLTLIAPDAEVTRSAYDALHRLTSVTTRHGVTEYAYDRASRLTRTTYPSGTQATQAYDAAGRVTRLGHTHQGAPLTTYSYTYDANGNRATQRVTQPVGEEVTTYAYDATDRLREVHYPDITTTYTYDAVGNRLTERTLRPADGQLVADKTYIYNTRQQVIAFTDQQAPAPLTTFTYDATGNRTAQTVDGHITTYLYDARHQLRQLAQDAILAGDYHYDWQGLRVRKITPQDIVRYLYDRQAPVLVMNETEAIQSRYTYGPSHLLAVDDAGDAPQYALVDALGSVMALHHPDGSPQARYDYDAWGQPRAIAGQSSNRFAFTGHEYDADSGLYYAKARYYDPILGSFLSPDSVSGDPTHPPSLHPYLYAYGNPTGFIDPDGYQSLSTVIDQAAEGCGLFGCLGYAVLKGLYHASTLGFAAVHDPIRDAYDEGRVTAQEYYAYGVGGGLAVVGLNIATGQAGGAIASGTTTAIGRILLGGSVGAITAATDDALSQGTQVAAGLQEEFHIEQTGQAAVVGFVVGGVTIAAAEGRTALRAQYTERVKVAEVENVKESQINIGTIQESQPSPARLKSSTKSQESGLNSFAEKIRHKDNNVPNSTEAETANGGSQLEFTFRGDTRTPDVIFSEGFQPRGTNTDLYGYALENEASVFVATSKTPNVARDFALMQGGGYVYTIRRPSQGLDVNLILGSQSPFPHEFEIAIPGGIRHIDIRGVRQVAPNGKFVGPFIKNPLYEQE